MSDTASIAELAHTLHREAAQFVDDFLRLTLLYGDDHTELRKLIRASPAEQDAFLADLRKAATGEAPQTREVRKRTLTTLPAANELFSDLLNKRFIGWSGWKGTRPEGFYQQERAEALKKRNRKEKRTA